MIISSFLCCFTKFNDRLEFKKLKDIPIEERIQKKGHVDGIKKIIKLIKF